MKAKYAVIILVAGYCLDFVGAWFKILHMADANMIFTISTFVKILGLLLVLYKLVTYPKLKDFFES